MSNTTILISNLDQVGGFESCAPAQFDVGPQIFCRQWGRHRQWPSGNLFTLLYLYNAPEGSYIGHGQIPSRTTINVHESRETAADAVTRTPWMVMKYAACTKQKDELFGFRNSYIPPRRQWIITKNANLKAANIILLLFRLNTNQTYNIYGIRISARKAVGSGSNWEWDALNRRPSNPKSANLTTGWQPVSCVDLLA